ncbi:BMP family ABC transporter substrate-binding protein [Isoptericola sp. NEAU-Y5]|uniref:BMP family ABC transporter substrate-binding protein n=1 Tax=Isoptericola luteus TaxID=2879484 RepID=A0ABS7ZBE6_9MICO|nr:BMP family ABC transporter substrate-binding protein [Isoptericola sp. NEAU-Y5]MCA5892368.1 BMP family ABC transporter substrate-binding protein [Isoptericola sp. NEAU-Y5]
MKRAIQLTALASVAALALAACAEAPDETGDGNGGNAASDFKPCIVSDQGGFDDKSFNQLSFEGASAAAEELGAELTDVQSQSESDFKPNIESLVGQNCDVIVSVGFALSAATVESATANPDTEYIIVDDAADNDFDGTTDAENIKPLLYDTAQAAFLAGYLSAGYSEAGKVGTFGGQPFPTVTIFMDGFKQGVEHYNEVKGAEVEVIGFTGGEEGSFTGGFEANETAKTTAQNIIDQGVDVLLPVGGPIYQSAIAAIQDSGRDIALVGVDADFFETDPSTQDYVLTSILKRMDVSTQEAVTAAGNGEFDPTPYVGTLENEGVGLAPLHNFEDKVDPALMDEVNTLKEQIISGEVEVTSYLAGSE